MKTLMRNGLLLCLVVLGCGRTKFFAQPQACVFDSDCSDGLRCVNAECVEFNLRDGGFDYGRKRFGEACDAGNDCNSELCVGGPAGAFCTEPCDGVDAGCPGAYTCKHVPDAGADGVCTIAQPLLCQACGQDLDCGASGADRCFKDELDAGFCGRDCRFTGCPELFACTDGQCVPRARTCDCVEENVGLQKACLGADSGFGRCLGNTTCQADGGFTVCDAPPALEETCNGADDDCDGDIDELDATECTRTVGGVTCTGPNVCFAGAGLVCTARDPAPEVCNYEDDDCDGRIDEDFTPGRGLYSTLQHCGACNNDCARIIAHAITTQCDISNDVPTCRVTQCEPGYFPFEDGTMCLELPDTLCGPCQVDADCVGPGARCLDLDGAKVCGRDCGPSSLYPPGCPAGFTCQAQTGGGSQCAPTTGSCACRVDTNGTTRSCSVTNGGMTCRGFSTCSGTTWSTCDVSSFNPEICDGRDNNCDARVDEGFLNQATGRYEAVQHCGFCNNDCTAYFSPTLQHTTGVCNLAPAMPTCAMGPCLTETSGGITFEWVNVNGETADGCECRRVQGNLTNDLPDRLPSSTGGASYVDENCDGIDGVLADAIFVNATAAPGGNGTRTAPLQTIAAGVAAQQAQGKRYVLVAGGLYRENVALFDGAQVFGGYAADFLRRDPLLYATTWQGVAPTGTALAAVHAQTLGSAAALRDTVVSGFVINGWDATANLAPGASGPESIAVFLRDVGTKFVLQNNDVIAGRGSAGARGSTGTQGFGRQASNALNGTAGVNSAFFSSGTCGAANLRAGGVAGTNPQCTVANGTPGGNVICPVYSMATHTGAQQTYAAPSPGSRNGPGGFDWSFDEFSGGGCSHVTESGWPTSIQQHDGEDGRPGADGSGGNGGPGAATRARFGSFSGGRWVVSPHGATSGNAGGVAEGGGGGGAGGGVFRFTAGGCQGWEIGATGGGAGAGGCGGTGGASGGAGGGSFGVVIVATLPNSPLPTLLNNRIQRAAGGIGGEGGFGGPGGLGGSGGFGGNAARWSSSVGGKGGEGGNGGPGGGGGGGAGGPSFGVLSLNVPLGAFSATNTFLTSTSVDTGGLGGAGGSSPGSGTGTSGARGASANLQALTVCGVGLACTGGTCDANGICVPN